MIGVAATIMEAASRPSWRQDAHCGQALLVTLVAGLLCGAPFGGGIGLMAGAARGGPVFDGGPRRLLPVDALIAAAQAAGPAAFAALVILGPLNGWRHAVSWVSQASLMQLGPTQARAAIGGTLWLALAVALMVHRAAAPRVAGPLPPLERWSLAGSGFAAGLFGLPMLAALALS